MMDLASFAEFAGGGGLAGVLAVMGKEAVSIFRARSRDRKDEIKREDKRLNDCEERFTKLSAEISVIRDSFQNVLLDKIIASSLAMTSAADAQREGNTLQRENIAVLDRVCRRLETLPCAQRDDRAADPDRRTALNDITPLSTNR